jgi:imidazolonepropionase-like amidohydrolase
MPAPAGDPADAITAGTATAAELLGLARQRAGIEALV